MSRDPRDAALQTACPTIAVPRFGELDEAPAGQRVLVASNGIFLEVTRSWLHYVVRLSELPSKPPLPYGQVSARLSFSFGVIPMTLLEQFIGHGRAALPNEAAGALIFSRSSRQLRLVMHEALAAGPGGIRYRIHPLEDDEELAVDLHTHGRLGAFWSSTDDADDQGVKVCGVFGDLLSDQPSAAFRIAVNGHFADLPHPWAFDEGPGPDPEHDADLAPPMRCPTLDALGFETTETWNT